MSNYNVKNIRANINIIEQEIKDLELKGVTTSFDIELHILEKFPEFYSLYPFLVKKICKKDDYTLLFDILNKLENVENGNENFTDVEQKLSMDLANKYLYLNINNK